MNHLSVFKKDLDFFKKKYMHILLLLQNDKTIDLKNHIKLLKFAKKILILEDLIKKEEEKEKRRKNATFKTRLGKQKSNIRPGKKNS